MHIKEFSAKHSVKLFYSTIILLLLVIGLVCAGFSHRGFESRGRGGFGGYGGRSGMMQGGWGTNGGNYGQGQYQGNAGQPGVAGTTTLTAPTTAGADAQVNQ